MGYRVNRTYDVNKKLSEWISSRKMRASLIADEANIRRDTFSNILACRRPIYADEIIPISKASGCPLEFLFGLQNSD